MLAHTNLDMDVLRSFAAGMALGSFAKAAERLGRSQSALSGQLRKLEEQVGQPLLRRQGRGLVPTEAGELMLSYAKRLLELNDEAMAALTGTQVEGWVRVGMPQDLAETWLPPTLGQFKRAHPRVRVEARVERNAELIQRVAAGQLDLALAWGEPAGGASVERVGELPLAWIGAADAAEPLLEPGEPLPLVAFELPCLFRTAGVAALDAAGIAWRLAVTSPSLAGLWAATAAGLGVTLRTPIGLPASLRMLDPEESGLPLLPRITLCLYRAETEPAPAAARLCAILKETMAQSIALLALPSWRTATHRA